MLVMDVTVVKEKVVGARGVASRGRMNEDLLSLMKTTLFVFL